MEDIGLMRAIPGMTVLCPCDANETREAVRAMIEYDGPCYMRTGRTAVEDITGTYGHYSFKLGRGIVLHSGMDVTLIAAGLMVQESVKAAELLGREGISARVSDMPTIKPIDRELILQAAEESGAVVTADNHIILTGLGSAVAEVLAQGCPVPVEMAGVEDIFGRSGNAFELMRRCGLCAENVAQKARKALSRKKR